MRGHLTEKTDVFAFGVLALEIVSGRPSSDSSLEEEKMYLLEWVRVINFCIVKFHLWNLIHFSHQYIVIDDFVCFLGMEFT